MTVVQDTAMRVLEKQLRVLRFEVIALPKRIREEWKVRDGEVVVLVPGQHAWFCI